MEAKASRRRMSPGARAYMAARLGYAPQSRDPEYMRGYRAGKKAERDRDRV